MRLNKGWIKEAMGHFTFRIAGNSRWEGPEYEEIHFNKKNGFRSVLRAGTAKY